MRYVLQYNCEREPHLVERLTKIVEDFQPQAYLAPFPGMDAKIALAAPGRMETLDDLDGQAIR